MVAIARIHDWVPGPGSVVSWQPSPASVAKAARAPISAVPVSYQQAQHIRSYCRYAAQGVDMARLIMGGWDIPGRCDIRAMTYVVNAHLRRHDTYRSWFEFTGERIVRHTIADAADIEFAPTRHGEMTTEQWHDHILATPGPLRWDCFRFGLIQGPKHFTFYLSFDHLHIDPTIIGVVFVEIHAMYYALAEGAAPIRLPEPGSYDDFCLDQARYTSTLTLESPPVKTWIQFAENNGGTLPGFPLPLGEPSGHNGGDLMVVQLMDGEQTNRFEFACVAAGARLSGGVFACAALAAHELTGAETFHAITPSNTRGAQSEFMTSGWMVGLVPISVPICATSFEVTALAAQIAFDSGIHAANVPFERVVELAPWLRTPEPGNLMLSFLDVGAPPFNGVASTQFDAMNARAYSDSKFSHQVGMWVNRMVKDTSVTVLLPDNRTARESVARYLATMKSICVRVAEGRGEPTSVRKLAQA